MGFWQKTPNSVKVEIRSLVLGKCSKSLTNFFKICNRFNRCACILPAHIELSKWPFGFFPVNFQPLTPADYALNSPFMSFRHHGCVKMQPWKRIGASFWDILLCTWQTHWILFLTVVIFQSTCEHALECTKSFTKWHNQNMISVLMLVV